MHSAFLILIAVAVVVLGMAAPGVGASIAAVAAFGFYCFSVSHRMYALAVCTLPFLVWRWTIFLSLVAIEAGAYMPEIGRQGGFVNAAPLFLLAMTALFLGAEWSFALARRRAPAATVGTPHALFVAATIGIVTLAVLFLLTLGLTRGFPLLTQTDRFAFRFQTGGYFFTFIIGNVCALGALLGVAFVAAKRRATQMLVGALTALFFGVLFLFGEKFFTIIAAASLFIAPALLKAGRRRIGFNTWALGAVALCASAAVTWQIYSDYGRATTADTLDKLGSRAAAQGELWYAAVEEGRFADGDPRQIEAMLDTLWRYDSPRHTFENSVGIYYLMRRYAPGERLESLDKSEGYITYTAGTEAYFLVTLGLAGALAAIAAFGGIIGLTSAYLTYAFANPTFLRIAFAAKAVSYVLDASTQAALYNVLGLRGVGLVIVIVAYETATRVFNKRALPQPGPRPSNIDPVPELRRP